ncbi:glycosyltransferase family 4 protein [Paenibacillus sp. ATY16]|uniref:glycosyltransferase family 4 protein n=1 Tax=Paenibacillus sp. ATY16 TaxID=1759312 RepID=UPI00200C985D|nr:glycosyltransferase family 4 protein [Paenibacillus sp. ATY16]MCK9861965.1 glycosyltransferase family 4 protein [Paenibacillus sp. ATY16]
MKVLDITLFYPPQAGGAVTTTMEFIKALVALGHEVHVLAPAEGENIDSLKLKKINYKKPLDHTVHRVKLPRKYKKWTVSFVYFFYAYKYLKKTKFDAILAHFHFNTSIGWTAFLLSKLFKCKLYVRIHDLYEPITWKQKLFYSVNRIPLKYSTKILTINQVSKDFLIAKNYAPITSIEVIPNGVSGIEYNKDIMKSKNKVCFLGTISANRGFNLLIPVVKEIKKKLDNIEVHLIGEGPGIEAIKEIIQKDIELNGNIFIYGALEREHALNIVAEMDVCLGLLGRDNSNEYQLLIKLIESIHLGIPWVSVSTKGVNEFHGQTDSGLIVPEKVEHIADAIVKLLNDEQLYQNKVENGIRNRNQFNWNEISLKLDALLQNGGIS